jgi:hypothetical protein
LEDDIMKKLLYPLIVAALLCSVFTIGVSAQETVYISDPTISDTPVMLPRADAALWNADFRCNPALLKLDCPYMFILDGYYLGGYHKKSAGDFTYDPTLPSTLARASLEADYILNVAGGDIGFALKLNDRANLAFLFNYRYGNVLGDGDIASTYNYLGAYLGFFNGSFDQRLDSHTFAPSIMFSAKMSDSLTFGGALRYAYVSERFEEDINGAGVGDTIFGTLTENLLVDRELWLRYHYLSPKLGISYAPSDRFVLNASVAAGIYFGGVAKDASLYDDAFSGQITPSLYTEDLNSSDVSGWDIAAKVRPEFKVTDALSIPLAVDFWYKDFRWGVGGTAAGYFGPLAYGGVFQGPGLIDYDNETKTWDITAGAGMKYNAGWATLSGMLSYTRWDFDNQYDQYNLVADTTFGLDGVTLFHQNDHETRDILSLALTVEKEFSPKFSADLGLRYDLGWGHRTYGFTYMSPFETSTVVPLFVNTEGRDTYQDLTVSVNTTFTPMDRLSIALSSFVTIPLDSLDYDLDGSAVGWAGAGTGYRVGAFEGPVFKDYENTGWEYGGMLSITFEFGCPVAVPPAPAPAPVIEPKLEPMSKN